MNIIGIDLGTSLTKIIECNEELNIINKMISSEKKVIKVLEDFVYKNNINMNNIEKIVITGVGSSRINEVEIKGIKVVKENEFLSMASGGIELGKKEEAIIVSMGTGTALVRVKGNNIRHLGGTGIGGATLIKLSNRIASTNSFDEILEISNKGNLKNVDLTIGDITQEEISTLPKDITAANFGKLNGEANEADIILGIINMIFETVGMMAVFATRNDTIKDIILIGSLTKIPYLKTVLKGFKSLCDLNFIIPENAEYATVIGAVKSLYNTL